MKIPYFDNRGINGLAWREAPEGWAGVEIRTQEEANEKLNELCSETYAAARLRFAVVRPGERLTLTQVPNAKCDKGLSFNPLASHSDSVFYSYNPYPLGWVVIAGGEDPMHPNDVQKLVHDCRCAGVPVMFAGWGRYAPNCLCPGRQPHAEVSRPFGPQGMMFDCGPERSGRELFGVMVEDVPEEIEPQHPDMGPCHEEGECAFTRGLPGQWFCQGRSCGCAVWADENPKLFNQIDTYYTWMERRNAEYIRQEKATLKPPPPAAGIIEYQIPANWKPTPEAVNALPAPIQLYVHDLVTGDVPLLVQKVAELEAQRDALLQRGS